MTVIPTQAIGLVLFHGVDKQPGIWLLVYLGTHILT